MTMNQAKPCFQISCSNVCGRIATSPACDSTAGVMLRLLRHFRTPKDDWCCEEQTDLLEYWNQIDTEIQTPHPHLLPWPKKQASVPSSISTSRNLNSTFRYRIHAKSNSVTSPSISPSLNTINLSFRGSPCSPCCPCLSSSLPSSPAPLNPSLPSLPSIPPHRRLYLATR